jgi:hypothetical protein
MAGVQLRTLCRTLLKQLDILPVPFQYILSLMSFSINNQEIFQTNSLPPPLSLSVHVRAGGRVCVRACACGRVCVCQYRGGIWYDKWRGYGMCVWL